MQIPRIFSRSTSPKKPAERPLSPWKLGRLGWLFFLFAVFFVPLRSFAGLTVEQLRCENAVNPLGIDSAHPRLSWDLSAKERGEDSSAYRILIATSPALLSQNKGDEWDSGKVTSTDTIGITDGGAPLKSATRFWWKVKVWDQSDHESDWSEPGWFETGLLKSDDWVGKWISTGEREETGGITMKGAEWIWYPEDETTLSDYPSGKRWFRKTFQLSQVDTLREAMLVATADDRLQVWINGQDVGKAGLRSSPVFQNVLEKLHPGTNQITVEAENRGKGYAGLIVALRLTRSDAQEPQQILTDSTWEAYNQMPQGWPGEISSSAALAARSLGPYGMKPWDDLALPRLQTTPMISAPLFRKEFTLTKPLASARLYICGLGIYEAYLNGRRVGDRVLEPAMTRYDKRALYSVYDVTDLLTSGNNAVGVELGRGFFSIREKTPWRWKDAAWNQPPALLGQISLHYQDGSSETIASDASWKMNLEGPTLNDSMYWGEIYDARREMSGWTSHGFSEANWQASKEVPGPTNNLHVSTMPPMRVIKTTAPVSVKSPKPDVYVFDVGFVTAGWARLKASAPAGTAVTISYAERLNSDGTAGRISANSDNGSQQTDVYVFKGQGQEEWAPKFSYKGFKFVEITGMPTPLTVDNLAIETVHNDVEITGEFTCSNPLFNRIHEAMVRTMLNNFQGKPTDTPAYEKNGWMGDANVALETMFYNFDVGSFLGNWVDDIFDCQTPEGKISVINPTGVWGYGSDPVWTTACFFTPWHLRQYTGDDYSFQQHRVGIDKYLAAEVAKLKDGVCGNGLGDWSSPGTDTARRKGPSAPEGGALAGTAYLLRALTFELEQKAPTTGESAPPFSAATIQQITDAFNSQFLDPSSGIYHTPIPTELRQTSQILPLYFGLVPKELKNKTFAALVNDIHQRDDHLDTGVLGTKYLFPLLTENGQGELAYKIANQKTYPSWGYWLENGATTMWETWELHPRSNDHYFLGTIDEWFYKYLAGIDHVQDGFKSFTICPWILGDMTSAQARLKTARGLVSSEWEKAPNGNVILRVTIPAGCSATVGVPSAGSLPVTESGKPAENSPGIKFLKKDSQRSWYNVRSGSYEFTSSLK